MVLFGFIRLNRGFSKGYSECKSLFLFSRLLRFRYAPTVWLGSPPSLIDGRGWLHSFDSHCTRHSGVGQEIVEKGRWLARPFGVSGWMIYGAEAFLLARGDWSNGDHHPRTVGRLAIPDRSAAPAAAAPSAGRIGASTAKGAAQTSPFATACSSFAPPRPATTRSAADFYHSQLWPTVRFWERAFWILNGGERGARDVVLRRLPKSPGLRLLDVIGDGVYTSWLRQD